MTTNTFHLWISITGHGLGHLTQTAPLVERLRRCIPHCRVTVQTRIPERIVAERIGRPFYLVPELEDIGMAMANAIDTLPDASFEAYGRLHRNWAAHLARQVDLLRADPPDLLIANVSYLALAGAQALKIPNVGLCSLNWADIFAGYCGHRPEAAPWIKRMRAIYAGVDLFLRPEPSMPMAWLPNGRDIGPITTLGRERRGELCAALGIASEDRLVLVTLGGIPFAIDYGAWAAESGVQFILQGEMPAAGAGGARGGHLHALSRLAMPFPDLVRSVDAVVTKPGYGTFAKCGCLGKPVLYIPRRDWPEEPFTVAWLHRHTRAAAIGRERLMQGHFLAALEALWALPAPQPAEPSGAAEGTALILEAVVGN